MIAWVGMRVLLWVCLQDPLAGAALGGLGGGTSVL